MRARRPNFYSLKRPKVRQSWNKYNLFNLQGFRPPRANRTRTFYQQKWAAKSMTRGYHGPHIRERDWARMFDRRLHGTVELDPDYLARHDGTEQSAGRGSGKQTQPGSRQSSISAGQFASHERRRLSDRYWMKSGPLKEPPILDAPIRNMTPYMQMTFAPMERRLDVAIFRAMFASSTLQARQFCVHGAVTVNGKKMRYPAYRLNPGDMFQVDVERVLFAAGKPKNPQETARVAKMLEEQEQRAAAREANDEAIRVAKANELAAKLGAPLASTSGEDAAAAETETAAEAAPSTDAAAVESTLDEDGEPMTEEEQQAAHKRELKRLVLNAKSILKDKDNMSARQKQRLRLFLAEAKRNINLASSGRSRDEDGTAVDGSLSRKAVMTHLGDILKGHSLDSTDAAEGSEEAAAAEEDGGDKAAAKPTLAEQRAALTPAEQEALAKLLEEDAENPYDETKPYLTPWQPRDYLAPFAFIPRYLEVNHHICAAVYLRHPVARRGQTEVPTPFAYEQYQLAHNWYLRRR